MCAKIPKTCVLHLCLLNACRACCPVTRQVIVSPAFLKGICIFLHRLLRFSLLRYPLWHADDFLFYHFYPILYDLDWSVQFDSWFWVLVLFSVWNSYHHSIVNIYHLIKLSTFKRTYMSEIKMDCNFLSTSHMIRFRYFHELSFRRMISSPLPSWLNSIFLPFVQNAHPYKYAGENVDLQGLNIFKVLHLWAVYPMCFCISFHSGIDMKFSEKDKLLYDQSCVQTPNFNLNKGSFQMLCFSSS